jgi:hypothetical protein
LKPGLLISLLFLITFYSANGNAQWDDEMAERPSLKPIPGLRGGYDFDTDVWSVGGHIRFPLGLRFRRLRIIPSGDLFFVTGKPDWQLNMDAAIHLRIFYGGAGLAYLHRDFRQNGQKENKFGNNFFIGMPVLLPLRLRLPIIPFVEARWTGINNENLFRLVFGINIPLGSRRR